MLILRTEMGNCVLVQRPRRRWLGGRPRPVGRGRQVGGSAKVPVTGTLPDFGQNRSAGLRDPKWHFAGTRPARHDPRTVS
jgi:hypothetical protein